MNGTLEGKVALVTGGSSGIGRDSSLTFAREGAQVIVSDVSVEGGEETVSLIKEAGGVATFIKADVSKATDVEALITKSIEAYGRLDVAFNNAGIEGIRVPMDEFPEDQWDRVIAVNLKGVWLCMKHEIRQMLTQGGGVIVNSSSVAGLIGMKGSTAYASAKHGVIGLTKTAALEYATQGIRVNAVCPGAVRTPMTERLMGHDTEREDMYMTIQPIGRFGTSQEIAETVVWLCSDAASLITGVALPVDGGIVAQ